MTNKNVEQKKSNNFDNLKFLSTVVSGKEIAGVFTNIKSTKNNLDAFCKKIKIKKESVVKQIETDTRVKNEQAQKEKASDLLKKVVAEQTKISEMNFSNQGAEKRSTFASQNSQDKREVKSESSNTHKTYDNKNTQRSYENRNNQRQGEYQGSQRSFDNRRSNFDGTREFKPREGQSQNGTYSRPRDGQAGGYKPRDGQSTGFRPRDGQQTGGYKPREGQSQNTTYNRNRDGQPGGFRGRDGQTTGGYKPRDGQSTGYRGKDAPQTGGYRGAAGAPKTDRFGKSSDIVSFTNLAPKTGFNANKGKGKKTTGKEREGGLNAREKMRMGHISLNDDRGMDSENTTIRIKSKRNKESRVVERIEITSAVISEELLTVREFSEKIGKPVSEIIKKLLLLGLMYNINSVVDYETAELIAQEFGIELTRNIEKTAEEKLTEMFDYSSQELETVKRPAVVTVMGHVDHGKTSLLDYIKKSHIIQTEAGGITQHIGAYSVEVKGEKITFIDTPGHEAFSQMRARGANVADIAILIVAADDGIMPQTKEAIRHIKEAKIPMIVAINKIDKPTANIERIKQQLADVEVLVEEWGGDTIYVPISAKSGENVDKLLENILLVAEINELKSNINAPAYATCIESKIETGRGIVANIIVKDGTLNVGDYVLCGMASGRVRAMTDYLGKTVKSAGPSMAVSLVGLNSVPDAGEIMYVVDEKFAKTVIDERSIKVQIEKTQNTSATSLETFLSQNADEQLKTYKVIVKADVQGTSEALKEQLENIKNEEVVVNVISTSVGVLNETDVLLAKASGAQIIAFNTKVDAKARQVADKNSIVIKNYKVIYEATDFVTQTIDSMKAPKYKEVQIGKAEVRQLFKISALGVIAGSYVLDGKITRVASIKVTRKGEVIAETTIENLQQQKNQTKEVRTGFECGIKLKDFNDIIVGDILVASEKVRIS